MEVELEEELLGRVSSAPGGAAGVPGPFQPVALVLSTRLCAEAARPPRLTSQAWSPLGGTSSGWVFPAFFTSCLCLRSVISISK